MSIELKSLLESKKNHDHQETPWFRKAWEWISDTETVPPNMYVTIRTLDIQKLFAEYKQTENIPNEIPYAANYQWRAKVDKNGDVIIVAEKPLTCFTRCQINILTHIRLLMLTDQHEIFVSKVWLQDVLKMTNQQR